MQHITESSAIIPIPSEEKISRQMGIFYNPVMKMNRDLSIAVLNAWERTDLQIADPFAASGIRSIRFLKELHKNKIKFLAINDHSENAVAQIKENLTKNVNTSEMSVHIFCQDANMFLLDSNGFDYIDIDPFGTPVPFLDSSCKRIARDGILAVTATDTSALAGAFPDACRRKYSAVPLHGPLMHEIGLRILIKKCQEIGAQYDKALVPLFSYAKDHYMRVFFLCQKGKTKANEIVKKHESFHYEEKTAGPLWTGALWDKEFVEKMKTEDLDAAKFLDLIKEEARIETVGFYDIHALCKKKRLQIPKYEFLFSAIEKAGHPVVRTHFSLNGIRTAMGEDDVVNVIQEIGKKQ